MPRWDGLVPYSMAFRLTPEGTRATAFQSSVEVVVTALHHSTHMDALVHAQANGRVYGDRSASEIREDGGWKEMGMETVPPIVGRCVLLDVAGQKGVQALPDRYEITVEDLERVCAEHSIQIQTGDIVLVRTGKVLQFWTDPEAFMSAQPGVGVAAATWLYERGMAVLGTDTPGTEPQPFADPESTTHKALLVERGVHLIENLNLEELAASGARVALFVCLPLKFTGATGSFVRPIAVV